MTLVGDSITQAASWLQRGFPVAIPTETVYGLAANACNPDALIKVFEAKRRPLFDPLIVHCPSVKAITNYALEIPPLALKLWECCSPGPLTLVLRRSSLLPDLLSSGLPTAGFRIPSHPVALELLNAIDFPLAAPSANLFGRVSPTTAAHVVDQLGGTIPYVLDGGPCMVGLESTIIDLSGPHPVLLREGGIPSQDIENELNLTLERPRHAFRVRDGFAPSPGTLESHYAPLVPMLCYHNNSELEDLLHRITNPKDISLLMPPTGLAPDNRSLGIIRYESDVSDTIRELWDELARGAALSIEILSAAGDLREAARNLFAAIRKLESSSQIILAEKVPDHGLGMAINDRLGRASLRANHP
jgi:L-threonylcarbamoyladenylate synthase